MNRQSVCLNHESVGLLKLGHYPLASSVYSTRSNAVS
jgi:hypothetical protein